MTSALERLEEKGVIRRVRTPAGAKRYGQPIGTIITRDMTRLGRIGSGRAKIRASRKANIQKRDKVIANSVEAPVVSSGRAATPPSQVGQATTGAAGRLTKKGFFDEPVVMGNRFQQRGSDGFHSVLIEATEGGDKHRVTGYLYNPYDSSYASGKKLRGTDVEGVREKMSKYLEGIYERTSKHSDEYDKDGNWHKNASYRDYDALPEHMLGIRGRDWWEEGDPEWDSGEEWDRWDLLQLEADDLGIEIDHASDDMDPEFAAQVLQTVRGMEEMYPGYASTLGRVEVSNRRRDAFGWNGIDYERGRDKDGRIKVLIGFPPKLAGYSYEGGKNLFWREKQQGLAKSNERIEKIAGKDYSPYGWAAVTADDLRTGLGIEKDEDMWQGAVTYTMTHELGHTIGWILFGNMNIGLNNKSTEEIRDWARTRSEYYDEFMDLLREFGIMDDRSKGAMPSELEAYVRNLTYINKQNASEQLSIYGASNLHETLAETWAAYHLSEAPSEFVTALGDLMETVLTDYLERV